MPSSLLDAGALLSVHNKHCAAAGDAAPSNMAMPPPAPSTCFAAPAKAGMALPRLMVHLALMVGQYVSFVVNSRFSVPQR